MINPEDKDVFIAKSKLAKISDKVIASRLGITLEEVEERWKRIQEEATLSVTTGYEQFSQQFVLLCQQYQMVGESLKIIAEGLSNAASVEELSQAISSESTNLAIAKKLKQSFIILRPFTAKDPLKSFQEHQKKVSEGN